MVQINFAQKEIQCKIVYYGPGMSGKTTNLELVHTKVPEQARGELTSIATTGERTLYFDYMPLDLGQIAGIRTKFQLYTVPGQIFYKSTRRLVLQGVDGIVFVADSSASKLEENRESLADLEENLKEMGKSLTDVPIVMQYNKRDLPDAMPIEALEKHLNPHKFPVFEAVANRGDGVFPTLKDLAGRVLERVNQGGLGRSRTPAAAPKRAAPKPPAPAGAPAAISASAARAPAARPGALTAASAFPGGIHVPSSAPATATAHGSGPPPTGNLRPAAGGTLHGAARPQPPPPSTASRSPQVPLPRAGLNERVVTVPGLGSQGRNFSVPLLVALGALIAGALFFALSRLF